MIFLSLLITVVVYLAFPFFYYLSEGKIPEKDAKKYSLINCIVCAIIFIIIRVATGSDAIGTAGFAPAVLYYFIGKAIMAEKPAKQNANNPPQITENNKNEENKGN